MIHGFHFIFSAYGFWLPNDPRGSWSDTIRQFNLQRFGPATKVNTTRSMADKPHDHAQRDAAKRAWKYPPVRFTGKQARTIAAGFTEAAQEHDYQVHALAILTDHAHMVMRWHQRDANDIAAHLKAKATRQLTRLDLHPLAAHTEKGRTPSPWGASTGARSSDPSSRCAPRSVTWRRTQRRQACHASAGAWCGPTDDDRRETESATSRVASYGNGTAS